MLADGAHIGVDGHAVVIEDDDEGLAGGSGVVESLVGKAAGEGPVPDEGQDLVVLVLQRPGPGHAQGHGDGVGCVPCNEGVVNALPGLGEAGEAIQLAEGGKKLLPPGESLMDIALVAHVKDQAVPLRIEAAVDGHGELHRPQVGGQVPTGSGDIVQQELPQLLAKLRQLIRRQGPEVPRGMDIFQNHGRIPHFRFWPPSRRRDGRKRALSRPFAVGCRFTGEPGRHRFS